MARQYQELTAQSHLCCYWLEHCVWDIQRSGISGNTQNYIDILVCPLTLRPHDNNVTITNNSQLRTAIQNGKSYASLKRLVTAQMRLHFNLLTSVEIQSNPSDFNRAPQDGHTSTDVRNWLIVLSIILTVKSLFRTQNYQTVAEKSVGCFCCSESKLKCFLRKQGL